MDAGDAETYAVVRPPHRGGPPRDPEKWWANAVDNVRAALALRKELKAPTRIVVSIIRQEQIEGKLDAAIDFWMKEVGVDEVITRKFLTWDDNTHIDAGPARWIRISTRSLPTQKKEPCVWPFERLNVDTLGRIALCGQDISFRTAELFPKRQRRVDQGDLAGRAVQLVPAHAPRRPRRGGVAVPRLLGLVCRHPRLGTRLAEGAEDVGRSPEGSHAEGPRRRGADLRARGASLTTCRRNVCASYRSSRRHLERTRVWANDPAIMRLMDRARPVSAGEHEAWFLSLADGTTVPISPLKRGEPELHVGNVWFFAIDRRHRKAELRVVIGETAARGQGYGAEGDRSTMSSRVRTARSAPDLCVRACDQSRGAAGVRARRVCARRHSSR